MPSKKGGKKPDAPEPAPVENDAAKALTTAVAGLNLGGSGGVDLSSLPAVILSRLSGIEALQKEYDGVHTQHMAELAALEEKYVALYGPLFAKRKDIILGVVEPAPAAPAALTDAPAADAPGTESAAAETAAAPAETATTPAPTAVTAPVPPAATSTAVVTASPAPAPAGPAVVGVPGFWLQAIKNHPDLGELVTPADEEALAALQDVSFTYLPGMAGFKLVFKFAPNSFFEDEELTKEYTLESMLRGEPSLLNIEAPPVHWKANKNLTIKKVKKKTKRGKPVFKEVKTESFFNFFSDPSEQGLEAEEPAEDEEDDEDDVYGKIHADFSQGLVFKDQLIPNAYKWFTGEGEDDDYEFGEDEGDDDEEEDDEEEEGDAKPKGGKGKKKGDEDDEEEDDEDGDEGNAAVAQSLSAAFGNAPKTGEGDKPADCKTQ